MKTTLNTKEISEKNKQIGQFKNLEEAAKYKNDIINKMLSKVDVKSLQNLGK